MPAPYARAPARTNMWSCVKNEFSAGPPTKPRPQNRSALGTSLSHERLRFGSLCTSIEYLWIKILQEILLYTDMYDFDLINSNLNECT